MTRDAFIKQLCKVFGDDLESIYARGLNNGWLEYEDELFRNDPINRKVIARIIHMYLLKERGIADIQDISKAQVLHDLYDCRVCVNHVAQIYLRGIMNAKDLNISSGGFLWFDLYGEDEESSTEEYLNKAFSLLEG